MWDSDVIGYRLRLNSSELEFQYGDSTNRFIVSSADGVITANTWQHVVATYDGKYVRLYVNGTLVDEEAHTGSIGDSTANPLMIGGYVNLATTYPFTGKLDDVRVYNRALGPMEVTNLYDWAPGPVGYWKLDEGSGTSANDSSGNGLTGTISTTNNPPSWSGGKYGKALHFPGTTASGGPIDMGANAESTLDFDAVSSFTYELWLKADGNIGAFDSPIFNEAYSRPGEVVSGPGVSQ